MPINAHPNYLAAEKKFHLASSSEEQLNALEEMISHAPSHKGAENLRAQLKTRYKKLKEKISKSKKSGKSSAQSIKKHSTQAVIIGKTNSGKSSLISLLTNTKPKIANYNFTTKTPQQGMFFHNDIQIQLIENPAINSENYDKSITNTADTLIILITELQQLKEILEQTKNSQAKKIIVFNKIDMLSENQQRKIKATLQSKYKKYNSVLVSLKNKKNLEELKEKIFTSFGKIRVYTKEPGENKSNKPIILPPNSIIKDVAEKILKGFSQKIKQTKIWGPSSKFPGQIIGLQHKLKDLDVVEFKTR